MPWSLGINCYQIYDASLLEVNFFNLLLNRLLFVMIRNFSSVYFFLLRVFNIAFQQFLMNNFNFSNFRKIVDAVRYVV